MLKTSSHRPWMQTTGGHRFYFDDPREGVIAIRDVARALSRIPRFGGHGTRTVNVAEHCVAVSRLVESRAPRDASREPLALAALLHDASEAYLCDVPTPLKSCTGMEWYREVESVTMSAVERAFHLPRGATHEAVVKRADLDCLAAEARFVFDRIDPGWEAWIAGCDTSCYVPQGLAARDAESLFLARYRELRGAKP